MYQTGSKNASYYLSNTELWTNWWPYHKVWTLNTFLSCVPGVRLKCIIAGLFDDCWLSARSSPTSNRRQQTLQAATISVHPSPLEMVFSVSVLMILGVISIATVNGLFILSSSRFVVCICTSCEHLLFVVFTCTFGFLQDLNPFILACFFLIVRIISLPNCSGPHWSNLPFLISDTRALWRSVLSARVPECQKLKMVG